MLKANSCLWPPPAAGRLEKRWVASAVRISRLMPRCSRLSRKMKSQRYARLKPACILPRPTCQYHCGRRPAEIDAISPLLPRQRQRAKLSLEQLERYEKLFAAGYVSREQLDGIQASHTTNTERVVEVKAQAAHCSAIVRPHKEIEAARTEVEAARAAVASKQAGGLEQRAVLPPAASLVHDTFYSEGEWIQAGSPVVRSSAAGNIKLRFFCARDPSGIS